MHAFEPRKLISYPDTITIDWSYRDKTVNTFFSFRQLYTDVDNYFTRIVLKSGVVIILFWGMGR